HLPLFSSLSIPPACLHLLSFLISPLPPPSTLFPYTTLFRSELQLKIMSLLPLKSIVTMSRVSTQWRELSLDEQLWRLMVQKLFVDRKSTRLNSSHVSISYAVFCLKKKKKRKAKKSRQKSMRS